MFPELLVRTMGIWIVQLCEIIQDHFIIDSESQAHLECICGKLREGCDSVQSSRSKWMKITMGVKSQNSPSQSPPFSQFADYILLLSWFTSYGVFHFCFSRVLGKGTCSPCLTMLEFCSLLISSRWDLKQYKNWSFKKGGMTQLILFPLLLHTVC